MDMLEAIRNSTRDTVSYTGRDKLSERVLNAMAKTPRHEFVGSDMQSRAYLNTALPITHGQTISQPFIVALMTDFIDPEPDHVVLEVGTGSGYQAAVLSPLVSHIYSIEIIPGLTESAAAVLDRLGYDNITLRTGDGYAGWPEHAPFDGIIVTAAAPHIPAPLVEQLKPGGRMIIPVDSSGGAQELILVEKSLDGGITERDVLPVRFVPFTGDR
ncbi:MAG: protein-L-isoaspartate(D-aspartate) O-methyltransferase [Halieaceae bacterium]|jgi:protein-L-isoaspartate(D-aspartate) O-methyltransferase|nr:protein-L-isoaspartate(D-aspartate) O-methyltransferase [Halieaceae bacterium]